GSTTGQALPTITQPVTIDGTTQPGCTSYPCIEIEGSAITATNPSPYGITISGTGSTIRGLVFNRFAYAGIFIWSSGGNTVVGNYIGTNLAGDAAQPNGMQGLYITSA